MIFYLKVNYYIIFRNISKMRVNIKFIKELKQKERKNINNKMVNT